MVRVGVIGFGQWGPNHVRAFRAIDDCDVLRLILGVGEERFEEHR